MTFALFITGEINITLHLTVVVSRALFECRKLSQIATRSPELTLVFDADEIVAHFIAH